MNVNMDFKGGVKFIRNKSGKGIQHIIVLTGCSTHVCHSSSQVADVVIEKLAAS